MAQQDVWALFALLESSDKRTLDEVKVLIHENLHTSHVPITVYSLVDYYMTSQSTASIDILVGLREPHDKALFDKLNEYMKGSTRLHVLTLLGYIVRKQPSWLHKIVQHQLIASIIRCLKHDNDVPVLMSACLIVSTLLPVVPVGFAHYLHDVFTIFARLASFSVKKPANVPDVFLLHLQVGVYALFHRLYGMYPCGFLAFLRTHYSKKENIVVFDQIVRPMLERVRVHPLLITGSKDMEVSTKRWKRMEIHDIVIECAKLSLDMIEGTFDSDTRPLLPFKAGGRFMNYDQMTYSAPTTPGIDPGQQFFSSSFVNDHSWHLGTPGGTNGAPGTPGGTNSGPGTPGGTNGGPGPAGPFHGVPGPLYQLDDGWTPSHSCGLHSPPSEVTSQNDSDFVHISPLPSQGTPSSTSLSYSSAPTTPADHSGTDTDIRASPSKRSRRKTVPIVSSKSLSHVEETNGSITLVKRLSLEGCHKDQQDTRKSDLEKLGHHLAKSDSLGLLTGGYRSDDKSGSGSRTPDPGGHGREESLPSVLEASLSASDVRDENDTDGGATLDDLDTDQKSCDVLTAQSAALFIRHVTRTRYTSMTSEFRVEDEVKRPRCRSMPSMLHNMEEVDKEDSPKHKLSPRRISQSSYHIPNSPAKVSPPIGKDEHWNTQRPRMPYEDLFPSALPYAPISQCQRCLDRSYAVPDYSAPVDLHRSQNNTPRVLGLEIPLFSTLAPAELLDRHLALSADLHPAKHKSRDDKAHAQWPQHAGVQEEVSQLKAQINQLHAQLMYERHRREQHAVRNRRLLGKITHTAAIEEQNSARKEQLTLQESEIKFLKTALESLRYEYSQYKEKQKEKDRSLQEQLSHLLERNGELHYKNTQLRSDLEVKDQGHTKLLNEFKALKSDSFKQRQDLEKARRQLIRHEYLMDQVSGLNKELLLMGELQNKYKEQLNVMERQNGRFNEHAQLLAPYKHEIEGLRSKYQCTGVQLDACLTRVKELEEQITIKERVITDQKRGVELLKSSHQCDVESLNWRNRSLQKIIHRLEQEIMDLFSKLHQQRNDEKGRSRSKVCPPNTSKDVIRTSHQEVISTSHQEVISTSHQSPSLSHPITSKVMSHSSDPSPSHPITISSPPPDHVTQFTPDVSSSLSPTDLHSNRKLHHSNQIKTIETIKNSHSNHVTHSNENQSSGVEPSSHELGLSNDSVQNVLPSNEDDFSTLPHSNSESFPTRQITPRRNISVSIPTEHKETRKPAETTQNHSYPSILPVNFDYTAWRSDRELMIATANDRPQTLDYDHDTQQNDDVTMSAVTSQAACLVDSGLHESKSE